MHVAVHQAGTKLSSNLQSQNRREPTLFVLRLRESHVRWDQQTSRQKKTVNRENDFFSTKMQICSGRMGGTLQKTSEDFPRIESIFTMPIEKKLRSPQKQKRQAGRIQNAPPKPEMRRPQILQIIYSAICANGFDLAHRGVCVICGRFEYTQPT